MVSRVIGARYSQEDSDDDPTTFESGRVPQCLCTSTASSRSDVAGLDRTVALIYARRDRDLIVVASNGGSGHHPAWYRNITADPNVHVQVGRKRTAATARIAAGDERDGLWALVNRKNRGLAWLIHPGAKGRYDMYQRHTRRVIPVVILTPSP